MAITLDAFTGSATISTTEWSLTTNTAGPGVNTTVGLYNVHLNLSNLAAGDVFEFKVYEKVLSTGSQLLYYYKRFSDAQATGGSLTECLPLGIGWDATLKKISGTDRVIDSRISKVA